MHCRNGFCSILVAVALCGVANGDERRSDSLLATSGWARFHVTLGRIEVANIQSSQSRTVANDSDGWSESLQVIGDTDIPSVRYERTGEDPISIAVIDGNRVEIERAGVSFRQIPGADIELRVTVSGKTDRYLAKALWHLMAAEPEVCRTHLLPLLEVMRPGWNLDSTFEKAVELLSIDESDRDIYSRDARLLVHRMNSPVFGVREISHQELRTLGVRVLPCLDAMERTGLTCEQRTRINRLRSEIGRRADHNNREDSSEIIAEWLSTDQGFREAAIK